MGQNEHTMFYTFIYIVFFLRNFLWKWKSENIVNILCNIAKVFHQSKDVLVFHLRKAELKQTNKKPHMRMYTPS